MMSSNLKVTRHIDLGEAHNAKVDYNLLDIIALHKVISVKLSVFADKVPVTAAEQQEIMEVETRLLDEHEELLASAASYPIASISDVKNLLEIWNLEVVEAQKNASLSAADEIIKTIYCFLKRRCP